AVFRLPFLPRSRSRPRRGARIGMEAIHAHRPRDVLDGVLALELVPERKLALDLIVGRAGEADPAAVGEALQARRDVHAVAIESLTLDDDVAEIDADAEPHPARVRQPGVARLDLPLDVDGALDGVDEPRQLGQHAC